MNPLVLLPEGRALPSLPTLGADAGLELRRVAVLPQVHDLPADRPVVAFVDAALAAGRSALLSALAERSALVGIGEAGERGPSGTLAEAGLIGWLPADADTSLGRAVLQGALRHAAALVAAARASEAQQSSASDLRELSRVGAALATERDLDTLLGMILTQARRLSDADAGSLYLVEKDEAGNPATLRFKLSQNTTLPELPFSEFSIPIDHSSLSGYVAATGERLMIGDVYLLPEHVSYRQNRSFDDKFGYRTKSMLVLPMFTLKDEIIGVLQLINRKRDFATVLSSAAVVDREVIAFDEYVTEVVSALAAQAAVAIENSHLYEDIERLFEGFVTAAVTAIESRDPTTSGHSFRVATLTTGLAESVDRAGEGPYRGLTFTKDQLRELRYAGLLHDFGKVGVREQVLVKQKKLYGHDLALLRSRFQYLMQQADLEYERERAEYLAEHGQADYLEATARLEDYRRGQRDRLARWLDAIGRANEPTILPEGTFHELEEIHRQTYVDFDGVVRPLLTDDELRFLTINKGNLDPRERQEIESHVTHTYRFLQQIPWTRELKGIPEIAYGHHEKLNGMGYPRGVAEPQIPVQTRMMTIADIYDALTATDRPYKRAVPVERALDILHAEAKGGLVDAHLLATFTAAQVWTRVTPSEGTRRRSGLTGQFQVP
ncbi:MAG: GAF domain-containing protein [Gemmatimonadaceae bacterium]|nr:GAF domain-containing protein [Gemmatimonadaceae bacterium]MCW5826315.1 GAF domain-containing protein [Gemmatimonadaceae bacterium]